MCAVVDACVFPIMFGENEKKKAPYVPVFKWVDSGDGKLIIGGTTYSNEIKGKKLQGIFVEFEKRNRLVRLNTAKVDVLEKGFYKKYPARQFDDAHLIAMVIISRCCVVCTDEKRALKYILDKKFYPKDMRPPKIYRNAGHQNLCCKDHVVKICRDDTKKKR